MSSNAGRPRKPTQLKELQGSARADRSNKFEPKLPAHLPDRPSWVDDDPQGAAIFDQVTEYTRQMAIHTQVDGLAISLLADQLTRYLNLRAIVLKEGEIITTQTAHGTEVMKVNPALPQMTALFASTLRMLREYGLTASSRANVSASMEQEINSFDDFMNG